MKSTVLSRGLLWSLFVACIYPAWTETDSLAQEQKGVHSNPAGVRVELRLGGGLSTFHFFEPIPIEMLFSSTNQSEYTVELDEFMNLAGQSDRFQADPSDKILLPSPAFSHGFACCASNRRYLSERPIVMKRMLTDYLRFEEPGVYSVFLSTRRVFHRLRKLNQPYASDLILTSNVLSLTILPDDPAWDAEQLAATLRRLDDPANRASYASIKRRLQRMQSETGHDFIVSNQINQTEFVLAGKALNMLDTQEGIRERLQRRYGEDGLGGSGAEANWVNPLLNSTTRPAAVAAAFEQRASEPKFGVTEDFVVEWARTLVQEDRNDLFRPSQDDQEHWKKELEAISLQIEAERQLISRLQALLPSKIAAAQRVTSQTIDAISKNTAPRKQPPPT